MCSLVSQVARSRFAPLSRWAAAAAAAFVALRACPSPPLSLSAGRASGAEVYGCQHLARPPPARVAQLVHSRSSCRCVRPHGLVSRRCFRLPLFGEGDKLRRAFARISPHSPLARAAQPSHRRSDLRRARLRLASLAASGCGLAVVPPACISFECVCVHLEAHPCTRVVPPQLLFLSCEYPTFHDHVHSDDWERATPHCSCHKTIGPLLSHYPTKSTSDRLDTMHWVLRR